MTRELNPGARDTVLASLLSRYPDAPIVAISDEGLFVRLPDVPELEGRPTLPGRSALDLVILFDRVRVIEAWEEARRNGGARARVELVASDGRHAELHFVDLTHRLGVFIGVLVADAGGGSETLDHLHHVVTVMPRVCRMLKNELAVITSVDQATTALLGWSVEELVGRRSLELVHPDDQDRAVQTWMEMLTTPGSAIRWRGRNLCKDGSWRWMDTTNSNRLGVEGESCVTTEMVDVSEEMAAHEAVREREQLLHRLAEALPLGVFQLDTERAILYMNARLADMVESDRMTSFDVLLDAVVGDDRGTLVQALDASLHHGCPCDTEVHVRLSGGDERLWAINLRALTSDSGATTGVVGCVADVTESAQLRRELERRATFDELTGCHNRASVVSALESLMRHDQREGRSTGVIFIDLDRFKAVNDELGHASGDRLLRVVADRLRGAVRSADVVGRLGGDEFLVVSPGLRSPQEAVAVAERIAEALRAPLDLDGTTLWPVASLGVACSSDGLASAERLIHRADAAMYESKRLAEGLPISAGSTAEETGGHLVG